jgi:hypothetical protein
MLDMTLTEMRLVRSELTRELRELNDAARANLDFAAMFSDMPKLAAMRRSHAAMLERQAEDLYHAIEELSDAIFNQELAA